MIVGPGNSPRTLPKSLLYFFASIVRSINKLLSFLFVLQLDLVLDKLL